MLAVFTVAAGAYAVPARPGITQTVQPDGSVISIRMEGDEYGHLVFDEHGNLLQLDQRGFYVKSSEDPQLLREAISERKAMRSEARRSKRQGSESAGNIGLMSFSNFPATGSNPTLVILVAFKDRDFMVDQPNDFFDRMLNGDEFTDYKATGSARSYFVSNSGGLFTPHFDVVGPVTVPGTVADYGANIKMGGNGLVTLVDDAKPYQMVIDACNILEAEGFDFSRYDTNGDGEIDNVYVYYAGFGEADGGDPSTIWPHATYLDEIPGVDPVMYDGVLLNHYACSNELNFPRKFGDEVIPAGIGTLVHEFTHVMGFPDLYPTRGKFCISPLYWSVMDVGCYLNNSRTPPNLSGVERYAFGWISPEELAAGEWSLECLDSENANTLIAWRQQPGADGKVPDEYFIFENRQLVGWDKYLPAHGMLIWHVDFDQEIWDTNGVNSYAERPRVRLVEADNQPPKFEIVEEPGKKPEYKEVYYDEGDTYPGITGNTGLTPTTVPPFVDWDGNAMPYDVVDITETSDGLITFRVTAAGESGVETLPMETISEDKVRYYNFQGIEVKNPTQGQLLIKKEGSRAKKVTRP